MTKDMNMAELVALAQESMEIIGKKLLESRLAEDPRTSPVGFICRKCSHKFRIQEAEQRRSIKTAIGEIEYKRAYGVCDRCGHTAAPLDECLGIPSFGPSIETRQKICHAAVVGRSFEDGREILHEHSRIEISTKHVRTVAEREGRNLVEERNKKVTDYKEKQLEINSKDKPSLLVISADGGRIQTRQPIPDERWKEDKIGVVYDALPNPDIHAKFEDYKGAKAQTKTYIATMENWESMGWMLRAEAEHRGWLNAKSRVFISDGATHIRELKRSLIQWIPDLACP